MPGFDGTGPRGAGPMTGRGEGYCAIRLADDPGGVAFGYAGLKGKAACLRTARVWGVSMMPVYRRRLPYVIRPGGGLVRRRGRRARKGRRSAGR